MQDEVGETVVILDALLDALSATLSAATGTPASDLYYAIGDLRANAVTLIRSGVWGARLFACFELAIPAGATIADMEAVRLILAAQAPLSVTAVALTGAGIMMALAEEVRILAATTFASRTVIDAALAALIAAFEDVVETAADDGDSAAFQALIAAQAAAVTDLNARAQALPSIVAYAFARVMTSHALAQRLYGDASRADELREMNDAVDPHFMPIAGSALTE